MRNQHSVLIDFAFLKVAMVSMDHFFFFHLIALGIEGKHQFQNASLAVQMCKAWLDRHKKGMFEKI